MEGVTIRCKMRVMSVTQNKGADGSTENEQVQLTAVSGYNSDSDENKQWAKWTPCASFSITINNPNAFGKLSKGHEFYVDFTHADAAVSDPRPPRIPRPAGDSDRG
jgi:hypothetical protein